MTKIILEIPNHQDVQLLIAFVQRLNATVVEVEKKEKIKEKKSPIYWLEQLAKIDSFKEIDSPVEWQRMLRKDRILCSIN